MTEISQDVLDAISHEVMEHYEEIRQSGVTNMLNHIGVANAAADEGFDNLAMIAYDQDKYKVLLFNFGALMAYYDISQEPRF